MNHGGCHSQESNQADIVSISDRSVNMIHSNGSNDGNKLIGDISECDTQSLLTAYLDVFGIEPLRPFLLESLRKSISTAANPLPRSKHKKTLVAQPLRQSSSQKSVYSKHEDPPPLETLQPPSNTLPERLESHNVVDDVMNVHDVDQSDGDASSSILHSLSTPNQTVNNVRSTDNHLQSHHTSNQQSRSARSVSTVSISHRHYQSHRNRSDNRVNRESRGQKRNFAAPPSSMHSNSDHDHDRIHDRSHDRKSHSIHSTNHQLHQHSNPHHKHKSSRRRRKKRKRQHNHGRNHCNAQNDHRHSHSSQHRLNHKQHHQTYSPRLSPSLCSSGSNRSKSSNKRGSPCLKSIQIQSTNQPLLSRTTHVHHDEEEEDRWSAPELSSHNTIHHRTNLNPINVINGLNGGLNPIHPINAINAINTINAPFPSSIPPLPQPISINAPLSPLPIIHSRVSSLNYDEKDKGNGMNDSNLGANHLVNHRDHREDDNDEYDHFTDHSVQSMQSVQSIFSEHSAVSMPLSNPAIQPRGPSRSFSGGSAPILLIPAIQPVAASIGYPNNCDLGIFHGELADDLYFKILQYLDYHTLFCCLRFVSRSWCFIASQPASIGHIKITLPTTHSTNSMDCKQFQFVRLLEIEWKGDSKLDRWSDWSKTLNECGKANMRDIERLRILNFHDFSFSTFTVHPLKALLSQQRALKEIELMATVHWKEHDIADCVSLFLRTDVHETLESLILHNFVITPSKEELVALKQHRDEMLMLRSAKVFGEFLVKCRRLRTFRWYTDHIDRQYTCHGIQAAFCGIYLPSLDVHSGGTTSGGTSQSTSGIEDVHLPSFPFSHREEENALYQDMVRKLRLKRLHFRGDLSIMDWKEMGRRSPKLEYLHLNPSRTTNDSFTSCFTECGASLKYLVLEMGLASSGYYQNDELTNFILPYFRGKYLKNIQQIEITVKFLEEKSLFSFLLKCKCAHSLKKLTINAQFSYYIGHYLIRLFFCGLLTWFDWNVPCRLKEFQWDDEGWGHSEIYWTVCGEPTI